MEKSGVEFLKDALQTNRKKLKNIFHKDTLLESNISPADVKRSMKFVRAGGFDN